MYIANLTSMTVGPDASGDACPAEWIQDTSIPYPTVPAGPCTGVFGADDARCVPSKCTGTPSDGGVPCPDRSTEGACSDASGCDWWPSCPKSLAPNATLGAESCIDSPPPFEGTCRETATGEASSLTDFNACAAVTALATADACNAVTFASGTVGTPCTYEPKDWRCYLHFTIAENLRGTPMVIGATPAGMVLKRCPLVGIPVVGEQYVFGITGPCAWRKGDFVALSEVPESFLPMMQPESPEQCPAVDLNGGGSTTLVILLIVVLPLGGIVSTHPSTPHLRETFGTPPFGLQHSDCSTVVRVFAGAVWAAGEVLPDVFRAKEGGSAGG